MLSIGEILKITRLYKCSRQFKTKITSIQSESIIILKEFVAKIFTDKKFEDESDRCFISEEQVSDNASEQLLSIRKKTARLNEKIKEVLSSVLNKNTDYIQDNYITLRSGRYVIPVKTEFKNKVKGMLHDQSSSGATVYIEPEQVVELNNELKLLEIKEKEEIEKILRAFTDKIREAAAELSTNNILLIKADIAFAKAKYAHSIKAVMPQINSNGYINILNGRHPLIDENTVVPVSINLGNDFNFLVITGPNTGGKTVTLKLCGLLCVMALCGMFLPASDGSEISYFENIFCDIGDEQSIEHNLSTFSSHMKNIIQICDSANNKSLVLIDEIGAGTDPEEGAALALSILEHLLEQNCKGIITTHYSVLKEYAFIEKGVKNASMEFDPVNLKPTYKIKIGMPGSSNALEISKKMGLSEHIISRAYNNLSKEKIQFEQVLKSAERVRDEAEKNLAETKLLKNEYDIKVKDIEQESLRIKNIRENALSKAKTEARRIYNNAAYESELLIEQLKEIFKKQQIDDYDLTKARQLKKQLENSAYSLNETENIMTKDLIKAQPQDIKTGQSVYIKSLSNVFNIKDISKNKKEITVTSGNIDIKTNINDVYIIENDQKTNNINDTNVNINIKTDINIENSTVSSEVKLLGMTVLDALPKVDELLDSCSVNNISECKIIHGIGTGRLRKAVWEHLKTHPLVKSYRSGAYGEGEKGVTIVELK